MFICWGMCCLYSVSGGHWSANSSVESDDFYDGILIICSF